MDKRGVARSEASRDFQYARWQASLEVLAARLTGKSAELLAFNEVADKLREVGRTSRGIQQIPVEAIVGSVGRTSDFTRTFLPRLEEDQNRWVNVRTAASHVADLPPIEVYQIGNAYFVADGNHRVSIARRQGISYIDAYVTEVRTRVPLTPDVQPDDLIIKAELAAFLEYTRLDELQPGADFQVSVPGQYTHLENLIEVHRYFQEIIEARELSDREAVLHWYNNAYLPMIVAIREQGILRHFPGRTETDFYVWLATHRKMLEHELGWPIRPEVAVSRLVERIRPPAHGSLAQRMSRAVVNLVSSRSWPGQAASEAWNRERSLARYSGRLFSDVLVPLALPPTIGRPAPGWAAMGLALAVATAEQGQLCGLLFVPPGNPNAEMLISIVRQYFERTCFNANIQGTLAVEWGDPVGRICDRTAMLDIVVLCRDFLDGVQMDTGRGDLERFIRQSCRPILLADAEHKQLAQHALLVYDQAPQSQEALFLAAYLGEQWRTQLTVLTLGGSRSRSRNNSNNNPADRAREYLALHEIDAAFHLSSAGMDEAADLICQTATAAGCDLIVIGGYSRPRGFGRPATNARTPLLNQLLTNWQGMLLICP